jgi:cytochrome c-type biogenesis protein
MFDHAASPLFDGSEVNLVIAFIAGFITFFASCLLPLIPTYLAYLSGVSLSDPEAGEQRWSIVRVAFFFVLGFIATFVILGLTLNQFAAAVAPYRSLVEKLAGLLFISLGLFMLGVFKHPFFNQEKRFDAHSLFSKHKHLHALVTGIAFGFGWTPCIGPVLAVILYWSAQQASLWSGMGLLIVYGMGLGLPFLLVAAGFERIVPLLKKYKQVSIYTNYISAAVIILAGVLMFFGLFQSLSLVMLQYFNLNALAG